MDFLYFTMNFPIFSHHWVLFQSELAGGANLASAFYTQDALRVLFHEAT